MSVKIVGETGADKACGALPKYFSRRSAFLLCVFLALIGLCSPNVRASVRQSDAANIVVRPCKDSGAAQQSKSPPSKHGKTPETKTSDSSSGCVEIHAGVLQIQEYLQGLVRDLQWKISEEHTNENSWDFSRKVSLDQLLSFTRPERRPDGIEWQSGSASLQITTIEIDGGFARTTIRAQFRGIGENKDKLATPHEWYPLDSNGSLESSLVDALKKHFGGAKH